MEFIEHVRRPFKVLAVQITRENIAEVAALGVGDLKEKDDGTPYILCDRRVIPNIPRVYIGYYVTKMGENLRVYSRRIFDEQFMQIDENTAQWLAWLAGRTEEAQPDAPATAEAV